MSLVVEFVAAAADVGAAFVVVVAVVAAVAACIETFVAVVLGPSSLFPSLLSLSQNLSLPFLSDTQWFLIHLPFFLGLLHHLLFFFSSFSMESFLISSAFFLSLVLLLSPCSPLSPDSRSLSSNLSIICSSSLSISDISGEIPLARSSVVIFFLYFLERRVYRNLVPRVFRLPTRGSGRRKTLVQAGHVPPKKWEVTKKQ